MHSRLRSKRTALPWDDTECGQEEGEAEEEAGVALFAAQYLGVGVRKDVSATAEAAAAGPSVTGGEQAALLLDGERQTAAEHSRLKVGFWGAGTCLTAEFT